VRNDKRDRTHLILYFAGVIPVIWLALLIAPALGGNLADFLNKAESVFQHPFHIELCEDSLKLVLAFLVAYGIGIGAYLSDEKNYRRREEHGSAKWGKPSEISRKYASKDRANNKILTQNISIGLDGRKHRRNLNVLCVGGSGAGKTRFFAKPNLMNAATSYVCLDPKGGATRS
jgi:type IV secretion system protein VirD4